MDTTRRRDSILDVVAREGYVRLRDLSEKFGVATITIHRDLDALAAAGRVERVHGGARSVGGTAREVRTDYTARLGQAVAEKQVIAQRALQEIADGSTLFLDSSTSAFALAKLLQDEPGRGLTVVTNSPAIGSEIHAPQVHIIMLPGELNQPLRAITGRWTVEFINEVSFSLAIVSAAGISPSSGLLTTQRELAEVTKAALARSERQIALIDSSKFGVSALVRTAPVGQLDLIITDRGLAGDVETEYRAAGANLVLAP